MENPAKRKAILFIRIDAYTAYYCPEMKAGRKKITETYCNKNNIEILACHSIIAHCENFEEDFISALRQNMYGIPEQADLLLMYDSYEISDGVITPADLIALVKQLGLQLEFIEDL